MYLNNKYSTILLEAHTVLKHWAKKVYMSKQNLENSLLPWNFSIATWENKWQFCGTVKVKVAQFCLTLYDPKDYALHGILQARIVE